jgi:hypothetical protein
MIHVCHCPTPVWSVHARPGHLFLDNCSHPKLLVCGRCEGSKVVPCAATREDRCGQCALRHQRRLKRVIGSGFADRPSGFFFATATAPGADRLPWDKSRCNHDSALRCAGKIGCRVERLPASQWNGCAPQVWSWVMTEVRRRLSGHQVEFWKCWETQERGVLHLHAILWAAGVSQDRMREVWQEVLLISYNVPVGNGRCLLFVWGDQQTCDAVRSAKSLAELVELEGFDLEVAEAAVVKGDAAAQLKVIRYLAKYCVKGGVRASTCSRVTGELRKDGRGYRTWSASANWGLRMKQIKQAQRDWFAQQALEAEDRASGPGSTPGSAATLDTNSDFYAGLVGNSDGLTVSMPSKLV